MSYDGYKANWGRSTNIDRGVSKNHLQAADLNSVYTTVSSNSASWNSGGDGSGGSNTVISTNTQDIYTTFSTDSNYPKVKLLLHGEGTDGDTEIVDDSPNHYTIQNTKSENNFLSSGEKKYGSSSIFLSGGTTIAGDSNFSSVGLLLKFSDLADGSTTFTDKSSNGHTVTIASGYPGSIASTSKSKWGTSSLSGRIDVDPDASFDVGTGDFTIEAWVAWGAQQSYSFSGSDEGRNNAPQIGHQNSSSFGIAASNIIWDLTSSTVPTLNNSNFQHIAVCRGSGRLSIFIDGTRTATETSNTQNYEAPDYIGLGNNGFMDSFRLTKGVDRYGAANASITVPTAAFPESASDTTTGGGLKIQDEDFSIDGDFTIETFVQPKDITNGGVIYSSGTGHILALSGASGKLSYDGSGSAIATTVPVVTANTWSHIAVVREDNLLTVFANGVSALQTTESATGSPLGTTEFTIGMDSTSKNIFSGFIDEFRITDGVARYSGSTYTVPAAAFSGESRFEKTVVTGVSGTVAEAIATDTQAIKTFHSTDDEYHNVQLLLHCEGSNNDTDMDDDSRVGHHFNFKGNSKLSSTQKKFGSTSLFTGTSDNDHVLVDSDDTNFLELGTGDFTLEFWLYWDGVTGYQTVFDNGYGSGSTAGSWLVQTDNGNGRLKWYHNGGLLMTEGSDPTASTWLHYAIVRSSGTLKIYRNGIQTASASTSNAYFTPDKLSIGARNAGTYPFDGYLDEIRITKGIARYSGSDTSSANFTVPSAAFSGEALESTTVVTGITGVAAEAITLETDKVYSSFSTDAAYGKVRALLHMEKLDLTTTLPTSSIEIHDDSYKPGTYYKANEAALSTAQKKFGSSSLLLDGSNDYVYRQNVSNDDFYLGSQNWCWECWFYPTAINRAQSLLNQSNGGAASNSSAILYIDSSNNAGVYTTENTGWDNQAVSTSGEISAANQWYHIAGVRYNDHNGTDTLKIYVNGNSYASTDMTGKSIPASTRNFEVGVQDAGGDNHGYTAGYIDDVRVTIGDPRYTGNFTPPAAAHSGESRFQQTVVTGITGFTGPSDMTSAKTVVNSNSASWDSTYTTTNSISAGAAEAWAKFNGSGTPALDDSYNVSSIADTATGRFGVNFTTSMDDADYCAVVANGDDSTNTNRNVWSSVVNQAAGSFEINCYNGVNFDPDNVYFIVMDS